MLALKLSRQRLELYVFFVILVKLKKIRIWVLGNIWSLGRNAQSSVSGRASLRTVAYITFSLPFLLPITVSVAHAKLSVVVGFALQMLSLLILFLVVVCWHNGRAHTKQSCTKICRDVATNKVCRVSK